MRAAPLLLAAALGGSTPAPPAPPRDHSGLPIIGPAPEFLLRAQNGSVWDRMPFAYIQMNPDAELNLKPGDLVEVYNENGSTQAMVWPTASTRRNETFMLFAYPTGAVGNVVDKGVNELIIPNYK